MAAEAVAGAIIQVLIEKLATLADKKINLVRHFKRDLTKLQESVDTAQAYLHDAEKKEVTSRKVKDWLRKLEDLAFDADNVIDDIEYERLSKEVHLAEIENKMVRKNVPSCFPDCCIFPQKNNERLENHPEMGDNVIDEKVKKPTDSKTVKEKVQSWFSCCSPISHRLEMGPRIQDINERLEKINQSAKENGLHKSLARAPDKLDAKENREENEFAKDRIFLGRENEVSEIVKMLITTTPPAGQKSSAVLPIVGMGGKGKTTIARQVYHHEEVITHFGDKNRVWVYVSEKFDVLNILKTILKKFDTTEKPELETQQDFLRQLQKHLGDKKYLLVLDDVWNENTEVWDGFVNSLSGISSANGYCMIVTTRIEDVASTVKETLPAYKLKGLLEDDCWSIIKDKAFRGSDVPSLEFEEIGKNIARKCKGLPLAAKVVGGLLSSMKSKDEWKSIEENWLSDSKNPMSNILKLSFDHLPSPSLKKCFAYCSIFPKGHEIQKEQLVELWMAEGFLHTNRQKGNNKIDMETTGSKNFSFLLRNSLLQDVSDDYGNVTHCSMHDLLHDLACSVLCENTESVCKRRYIGYEPSGDGLSSIPEGQERYVRTLFVDRKVSSINFFDNFESLHTLTLVGYEINDLPTSIKKLKHLRYLDLSETGIRSLPDWIGELYLLQTLRFKKKKNMFLRESRISKLTDSLNCLISLRHLHISEGTTLPPYMGKLTSLQALPYFYVSDEKGCGISELGRLKNLKGELKIHNLYKVRNTIEAMGADLIGKTGIDNLELSWLDEDWKEVEVYETSVHESVLKGLQPQPNLETLNIFEFQGKIFPLCWERLNNLTEIKLKGCSECEELPMLGQLRKLKSVCLISLENLKCLPDGLFSNNHNLSKLRICNCPKMTRLGPFFQGGGALSLRKLSIEDCSSFRELHSLNSLEKLTIRSCPELKSLPYPSSRGGGGEQQQGFTSLVKLCIRYCEGLTDFPIEMLELCASSLESLELDGLSNLNNISEVIGCFHKMTRLTSLNIQEPPQFRIQLRLKRLAMGPSRPEYISDSSCNNVSFNETFDLLPSQILITLRILELRGMEHWDCLPDGIQHLTSLEELELYGFGIEAWPEWFGNYLPSLEALSLKSLKKLRHLPSTQALTRLSKLIELDIRDCPLLLKEESCNNIDSEYPTNNVSLQRLTLFGMVQLDSVPDQLQHLNALSFLHLGNLGIEALPEWFGNLSSLETLKLLRCKRLRHLPSKQAMLRLSKLMTLEILFCPLLLKEKESDNIDDNNSEDSQIVDSEWSKISHIPVVVQKINLIDLEKSVVRALEKDIAVNRANKMSKRMRFINQQQFHHSHNNL